MSNKKIALVCKNNIPVLIDLELSKNFTNIYKVVVEDCKDRIIINDIEVKTINNIIEYIKLSNNIEKNKDGPSNFIDKLEDNCFLDIVIAAKTLGIPKIILDFGNKIRNSLN